MQSVPSRMALATSVDSARVGSRLATMDSSICVAVMTGLPARLACAMSCFLHEGHFLDRHLHAEVAARHHDAIGRLQDLIEVLQGSGALDLGDDEGLPAARCGGGAHGLDVRRRLDERLAHGVHALLQRELEAGAVVLGEGADAQVDARQVEAFPRAELAAHRDVALHIGPRRPARPPTAPVRRSGTAGRPASRPGAGGRSSWRPAVRCRRCPRWSSVNRSPGSSGMGSGSIFPTRILGPGRSAMMATRCPVARSAARMRAIRSACPLKSPWEKLSRATFIPARIRRSSISGDSEAGPMVATILVLWSGSGIRASPTGG